MLDPGAAGLEKNSDGALCSLPLFLLISFLCLRQSFFEDYGQIISVPKSLILQMLFSVVCVRHVSAIRWVVL